MALEAVNQVLEIVDGREPVYSPWGVVHNTLVVEELSQRGLKDFNHKWEEVPDGSIVVFPAHGAPPEYYGIARAKNICVIDVTCPLVTRVHHLAMDAIGKRREIKDVSEVKHVIYIGAEGHPETVGVLGELDEGAHTLIDQKKWGKFTLREREEYMVNIFASLPKDRKKVVYSQTTLSPKDVDDILAVLGERVENLEIPSRRDICYAMDSRWFAVRDLIPKVNMLIVVGSKHSHNSQELRRTGEKVGVPSYSVDCPEEIDRRWFAPEIQRVGVTAGASVLEKYTGDILDWFLRKNPGISIKYEKQVILEKDMTFKLPQNSINVLKARYDSR